MGARIKSGHDDTGGGNADASLSGRMPVHSREPPARDYQEQVVPPKRERGAGEAPLAFSMWRLISAPRGVLRHPTRPLLFLRRLVPTEVQRCDISQGLAPWVDPSGHAATKVSGTFGTVPPALSEKSAGRDSGPSSEERQGEYKRGFLGGD